MPVEELEKKTGLTFHPALDKRNTVPLCKVDSCKLIPREQYELYFIGRKLESARTLERLEKVWAELEEKDLKPDAYAENLYNRKRDELTRESDKKQTTQSG